MDKNPIGRTKGFFIKGLQLINNRLDILKTKKASRTITYMIVLETLVIVT